MCSARVVVETNQSQKEALDHALQERGLSLTEWFSCKVAELTPTYETHIEDHSQINTLRELQDATELLQKLSAIDWAFTTANTTYLTHNLHPYPAKFIPQLPHTLIQALSLRGEKVWDPFGGSGTTAIEAILLGRQMISSDIHPIATLVGRAKTTLLSPSDQAQIVHIINNLEFITSSTQIVENSLQIYADQFKSLIPDIPNMSKWFDPNVIEELAYLKWLITTQECEHVNIFMQAIFSKIVLKVSHQDSETRYVSKPKKVPVGTVLKLYLTKLSNGLTRSRNLSRYVSHHAAEFVTADLRRNSVVEPNSIDAIITSPPYPNATDYHLYHRFRLFWLGHDPRQLAKCEIGSHLRHQKEKTGIEQYLQEMTQCLHNMYEGLRPGRYAVLVLGDAKFKGEQFATAELVGEQAATVGFEYVGIVHRQLHKTKRSFVSAARRLREEKLLILRKPQQVQTYQLHPPPYKLWHYEEVLRRKEIEALLATTPEPQQIVFPAYQINTLDAEQLRRLTFTHTFSGEQHYIEPTWQAILENGDAFKPDSLRKNSKYATHGIHAYKGKFYPQLAKSLFNLAQIDSSQTILDPFSGSGTVVLEGYLNGLNAMGYEINPLAVKISRVKTQILQIDSRIITYSLQLFTERLPEIDPNVAYTHYFAEQCLDELASWFSPAILNKLAAILTEIDRVAEPTVREFLEICLSSLIRDISHQDPKDLRVRRRKEPLEDAPVVEMLEKKIEEQANRLRRFAQNVNKAPHQFGRATVHKGDCRDLGLYETTGLLQNNVDAVITSPPYATALPYIDTDRLSILVLFGKRSAERSHIESSLIGSREIKKSERTKINYLIEQEAFSDIQSQTAQCIISQIYRLNKNADVGFRRKNKAATLYKYYRDMTLVLSNLHQVIRSDGNLFFVIGDNKTVAGDTEIIIKSSQMLQETGALLGWELVDVIPITVTQENRNHNKNGITANDIIWFKA